MTVRQDKERIQDKDKIAKVGDSDFEVTENITKQCKGET